MSVSADLAAEWGALANGPTPEQNHERWVQDLIALCTARTWFGSVLDEMAPSPISLAEFYRTPRDNAYARLKAQGAQQLEQTSGVPARHLYPREHPCPTCSGQGCADCEEEP